VKKKYFFHFDVENLSPESGSKNKNSGDMTKKHFQNLEIHENTSWGQNPL